MELEQKRSSRLLVVDDDQGVTDYLVEMLSNEGYEACGTTSPRDAISRISNSEFDLIVADIEMAEMRGTDLLSAIHREKPHQLILLITAFGSIDLAVQSIRMGACDFIAKPFKIEALFFAVERALRERRMRREIVRLYGSPPQIEAQSFVSRSPAMMPVMDAAFRVANTNLNLMITGESGVGKGALANYIHNLSPRRDKPFVQVNCAALPATLAESELFGVRRGAFTGAQEDRAGLFAKASGGTLFLDEIGEMNLETQPKLLQAIETNRVRPVGGDFETAIDVRVIAATNKPLEEALRERRFRQDLYYRLNVIRIEIPPLRERPEDIEALVDLFAKRAGERMKRPLLGISQEALCWLKAWQWPGNARELANVIERAVALAKHDTIVVDDLVSTIQPPSYGSKSLSDAAAERTPLDDVERAYILEVLKTTNGNKALAAKILNIDRRTIYRRIGLEEPEAGRD